MAHTEPPIVASPAQVDHEIRHANARTRFLEVVAFLQAHGWEYERIDTLIRTGADRGDRKQVTVRHHYDHGVWTLHLEPNRYWNRDAQPIRVARIDRDKDLPSVLAVVSELFGPQYQKYVNPEEAA